MLNGNRVQLDVRMMSKHVKTERTAIPMTWKMARNFFSAAGSGWNGVREYVGTNSDN